MDGNINDGGHVAGNDGCADGVLDGVPTGFPLRIFCLFFVPALRCILCAVPVCGWTLPCGRSWHCIAPAACLPATVYAPRLLPPLRALLRAYLRLPLPCPKRTRLTVDDSWRVTGVDVRLLYINDNGTASALAVGRGGCGACRMLGRGNQRGEEGGGRGTMTIPSSSVKSWTLDTAVISVSCSRRDGAAAYACCGRLLFI